MCGVLVTSHTRRDVISVSNCFRELNLEAEVVETGGMGLRHARELEVVGGNDTSNRQGADGLEEEAGSIELVKGVGTLQNLIQNDERVELTTVLS